jgi:outer membrane receptor for monomeric catechols
MALIKRHWLILTGRLIGILIAETRPVHRRAFYLQVLTYTEGAGKMKKNRFLLLFLLCCLMAGDSLRAEEPAAAAEKDDKAVKSAADAAAGKDKTGQVIIVTARGYESLLSKTPGGVGVIDSGELSHSGAVSISNALATVPGVSKTSDSAWGSEIVIRGASRGNLVFLVDGSRLVSASDYNAQFGTIDASSI